MAASGTGTSTASRVSKRGDTTFKDDSKQQDVRLSNIVAAKGEQCS